MSGLGFGGDALCVISHRITLTVTQKVPQFVPVPPRSRPPKQRREAVLLSSRGSSGGDESGQWQAQHIERWLAAARGVARGVALRLGPCWALRARTLFTRWTRVQTRQCHGLRRQRRTL